MICWDQIHQSDQVVLSTINIKSRTKILIFYNKWIKTNICMIKTSNQNICKQPIEVIIKALLVNIKFHHHKKTIWIIVEIILIIRGIIRGNLIKWVILEIIYQIWEEVLEMLIRIDNIRLIRNNKTYNNRNISELGRRIEVLEPKADYEFFVLLIRN